MMEYANLNFAGQVYNLDVSFFIELRRRILIDYRPWRLEFGIHAFAAVDGVLWLDMNSFERERCRFTKCARSSSNISTRYAVERAQRVSRCSPESHDSSDCGCTLVPGTLVVLPSLADFRACDLELEAAGACGNIVVGALGDISVFGVPIDLSILCHDGKFGGIHSLRRFFVILYMDIKACRCHFALASPTTKPKVPWHFFSSTAPNAPGRIESPERSQVTPFHFDNHDIHELVTALNASQSTSGFFACYRRDNNYVLADICKVHVIDEDSISIDGTRCDRANVIIGGLGCISPDGALPRHWSTVIMALCHILRLYESVVHLMLLGTNTLNMDITTMRDTAMEDMVVVYAIQFGPPLRSADHVTLSYGYQVNPDHLIIGVNKHEHVFDFMDDIDPNANYRIDAELHLQLMKWRIAGELKPKEITGLRTCIIGAGALGCQVIRLLLAWGVRNIAVIDHGKVTNSTRQCLYRGKDIYDQNFKATAACCEVQRIYPGANVIPLNMSVPMPGHFIPEEESAKAYKRLNTMMVQSDVVFLLTDSKESRWLPSLIGAAHTRNRKVCLGEDTLDMELLDTPIRESEYGPLIISAGVAFDSWMVIRHGYGSFEGGCYFCSDVQSPNDSISGRPMDETCTIVKPGAVAMCAASAVELAISLTQHPDGFQASHGSSSCLGEVPHAIRMSLSDLSVSKMYVEASEKCVCCSEGVVTRFNSDPVGFLQKVLHDSNYLSAASGLDVTLNNVSGYDAVNIRTENDFVIL